MTPGSNPGSVGMRTGTEQTQGSGTGAAAAGCGPGRLPGGHTAEQQPRAEPSPELQTAGAS